MEVITPIVLEADEGRVEVVPLGDGRSRVSLHPHDSALWLPRRECITSLPLGLVKAYLARSFPQLCDALARHDDPDYVARVLRLQLFAYSEQSAFRGKRLLDFGCGTGASTLWLAELLPETDIVGVDMDPAALKVAREVMALRNPPNARFLESPDGISLPRDIGMFDFVMLSAVYEHLLPEERRRALPLIWQSMKPGAVLFINQTPHRYSPFEYHTTGLWLINYLPDRLAFLLARKWSRQNRGAEGGSWTDYLRRGIRGGTEAEVLAHLRRAGNGTPVLMQPREGDRAGYWSARTSVIHWPMVKRIAAGVYRWTDRLFGTVPSMSLDVAIRKDAGDIRAT
jgi:SAM-dependent methyltransferase